MLDRADLVLAVIPVLAAGGLVVRTIVSSTGVASGLLALPLGPLGWVAALAVIWWELLVGPCPRRSGGRRMADD
ncbi:hypothetical protein [Natrarchaeobaculum aegyptiacum]|uniref:Uncharacterized protein n=1 Tax=Natrarchaeobaculum aegyptiacum TaxID=745377 RepID=A0A2Z2HZP5_9EURY|nr:hypothetical protein [Natrarchaeobaculum aegyptiacum]ARS91497.1 hypothetical protein B1756_18385 [Natrarchaeobaculum aegyptiacum]